MTYTDPGALMRWISEVDPPTLSYFEPSTSPLVGRGGVVGSRLPGRLMTERENNVTMRIEELPDERSLGFWSWYFAPPFLWKHAP